MNDSVITSSPMDESFIIPGIMRMMFILITFALIAVSIRNRFGLSQPLPPFRGAPGLPFASSGSLWLP